MSSSEDSVQVNPCCCNDEDSNSEDDDDDTVESWARGVEGGA